MNTPNAILMRQARVSLSPKWGLAIGTYLVYGLLTGAINKVFPAGLIFSGPFSLGLAIFSLDFSRGKNAEMKQIFDGFQKFEKSLVAFLLMTLYILLWSLLFIIPGILIALSYAQTYYILADDETITGHEAMKKSQELMTGKRWKLFCLGWRFFGWFLLCLLTLGIGFLWLIPYMNISYAKFYDDLKA